MYTGAASSIQRGGMAVIKHSSSGQGDLEGDVINLTASSNEIFFLSGGLYCDSISTILISHSPEMMPTASELTDDMDHRFSCLHSLTFFSGQLLFASRVGRHQLRKIMCV